CSDFWFLKFLTRKRGRSIICLKFRNGRWKTRPCTTIPTSLLSVCLSCLEFRGSGTPVFQSTRFSQKGLPTAFTVFMIRLMNRGKFKLRREQPYFLPVSGTRTIRSAFLFRNGLFLKVFSTAKLFALFAMAQMFFMGKMNT